MWAVIGIYAGDTQDILVEKNYLYDNGNSGSAFGHEQQPLAAGRRISAHAGSGCADCH